MNSWIVGLGIAFSIIGIAFAIVSLCDLMFESPSDYIDSD